jgi:hypothetical protein
MAKIRNSVVLKRTREEDRDINPNRKSRGGGPLRKKARLEEPVKMDLPDPNEDWSHLYHINNKDWKSQTYVHVSGPRHLVEALNKSIQTSALIETRMMLLPISYTASIIERLDQPNILQGAGWNKSEPYYDVFAALAKEASKTVQRGLLVACGYKPEDPRLVNMTVKRFTVCEKY